MHTGLVGCVFVVWFGQCTEIAFLVLLLGCAQPIYLDVNRFEGKCRKVPFTYQFGQKLYDSIHLRGFRCHCLHENTNSEQHFPTFFFPLSHRLIDSFMGLLPRSVSNLCQTTVETKTKNKQKYREFASNVSFDRHCCFACVCVCVCCSYAAAMRSSSESLGSKATNSECTKPRLR